jgi:AcrR family transcriptional regulator
MNMSMPTTRTQARRQKRRSEIVAAAQRLIDARGNAEFTTEELAEEADIGQASVFYYFKGGRSEIDAAIAIRRQWEVQREWLDAVADAPDGISALVTLVRTIEAQQERDPDITFQTVDAMMRGPWPQELLEEHVGEVNRLYDLMEEKLTIDRESGALSDEVRDLRRHTQLVVAQSIGVVVHASMIRAAGGQSKHAVSALFDDLVGVIERAARRR